MHLRSSTPPLRIRLLLSGVLSLVALLILGYHPYAEDGGIYLTALLQRLQPELYPHSHSLALAHLHHSGYIWVLTVLSKACSGHVEGLLFGVHVLSIFAILWALTEIAVRCFSSFSETFFAVSTAAIALSLPVAGTALYIADPYVTARSISTPLLLAALIALLDKRWIATIALVALALMLHPLMALWGSLFLIAFVVSQTRRPHRALLWFAAAAIAALGLVRLFSPAENLLAQQLAHSRSYWYLANWQWYEWIGLIAPPVLLAMLYRKSPASSRQSALVRSVIAIFWVSGIGSLLLVHPGSAHLLLARMQPLRMMHLAYLLFLFLLGAKVGAFVKEVRSARALFPLAGVAVAGCALFLMQRSLYGSSVHLEIPEDAPRNQWKEAFLWTRDHTPPDALFAMDAHYITSAGEDAQSFRAIAQRSSLPDYSKDGGVASVFVALAPEWQQGERAQEGLNKLTDAERLAHLRGTGASWILLPSDSATAFACPYQNAAVKVCRLPDSY